MLCKKGYVVFLVAQTTVKRQTQKQKTKINQQIIKKIKKAKRNTMPIMDHYPRNGKMADTAPQSDMSC